LLTVAIGSASTQGNGGATVALTEKDGGTLLTYNVETQIGGKLAQLGQRLVNGAAKKSRTISSPILPKR
jgi:carbon monoxide dehydrogenase subunit G